MFIPEINISINKNLQQFCIEVVPVVKGGDVENLHIKVNPLFGARIMIKMVIDSIFEQTKTDKLSSIRITYIKGGVIDIDIRRDDEDICYNYDVIFLVNSFKENCINKFIDLVNMYEKVPLLKDSYESINNFDYTYLCNDDTFNVTDIANEKCDVVIEHTLNFSIDSVKAYYKYAIFIRDFISSIVMSYINNNIYNICINEFDKMLYSINIVNKGNTISIDLKYRLKKENEKSYNPGDVYTILNAKQDFLSDLIVKWYDGITEKEEEQ